LDEDFVIFSTEYSYGIACFHKRAVDSATERFARMRAVGLLARDYRLLPRFAHVAAHDAHEHDAYVLHKQTKYTSRYIPTLHHFATRLNQQGEHAVDFSELEQFYRSQDVLDTSIPMAMTVSARY
jgi:uncharacterized protein YcbK (DUF882 family)